MIKVGITGQSGFIGTHLFNYLSLDSDCYQLIPFVDSIFDDSDLLTDWVSQCDAIVHLAAMNRHTDSNELYITNIRLVEKLILSLESCDSRAHVLFSSSSHEAFDNPYGNSKKEGRELLIQWAKRSEGKFTGLVIPNVFGPFGQPFYNSVVATFCHQLVQGEEPMVDNDKALNLIYVGELTRVIADCISDGKTEAEHIVAYTSGVKVTEILDLLKKFKFVYGEKGEFPELKSAFEVNLFNTFRSFMNIPKHFPVLLNQHEDERGSFVETMRLGLGGQVSFSTTKPGVTRGNHFHTRKIERFVVIRGKAKIQLRRIGTDEVQEYQLDGSSPSYVDMPVWYTHNITNVGDSELFTIFWINEFYNPDDPDTYFEIV